jgi:hypothetical protein
MKKNRPFNLDMYKFHVMDRSSGRVLIDPPLLNLGKKKKLY